jgi:hypothetical protein
LPTVDAGGRRRTGPKVRAGGTDPGGDLDRFLDGLSALDRGQLLAIAGTWETADSTARAAAWRSARRVAEALGWTHELDRTRETVAGWATTRLAITGWDSGAGMDRVLIDIRGRAAPALMDAAAAILLGDRLDEPSRAALLAAWESRSR